MDPEQHNRAAELFLLAVDLPPDQRTAFLEQQCQADVELLAHLRLLLQEDQQGPIFRDPAPEQSLSGQTLSHYQILEPIAGGGMATVYRAIDTRLERTVALKFLLPSLIGNAGSRQRFLREARALASIDHPNVCPVYDVEEVEGYTFLVMAYLQGTPLSRRTAGSPLSVDEAVNIALQTAQGLEAAHAKGLVHRDIKPANLMLIEPAGGRPLVRILDFGIAQGSGAHSLTQAGLTIGTVSYMAPEQTLQSRVDQRADIWSLGVVLYEMLSGKLPFNGDTAREVLAAIAGPAPVDLSVLPTLPVNLLAVLRCMLAKDVAQRYQSTTLLLRALESVSGELGNVRSIPVQQHPRLRWAAGLLFALLAVIALSRFHLRLTSEPPPKVVPITFYPGDEITPAISPDARQIAFAGQGRDGKNPFQLYVQLIGSTDPLRLTDAGSGVEDRFPIWEPSGNRIAFLRHRDGDPGARILFIPALGGTETDLGVDGVIASCGLSWHPDGHSMAYCAMSNDRAAIFEIQLDNHTRRQLTFPGKGENDCCPQYDPTGRRLAFKRNEVEIAVAEANQQVRLLPVRASWPGLGWSSSGRSLLYSWYGKLAEVDLEGHSRIHTELPLGPNLSSPNMRGDRLAYVRWDFEHSIWQVKLQRTSAGGARKIKPVSNAPLILSTARDDTPQFSPDGNFIAFASERSGSPNIWIGKRDGSNLRPLTQYDGQSAGTPRWSPDAKWLVFDLRRPSADPQVYLQAASGGEPRKLTSQPGGADVPSWSHDGRWVYFHARADDQIWKIPVDGGQPIRLTHAGGFEGFESADGRSLYYSKSDEISGIWQIDLATRHEAPIEALAQAGKYRHWAVSSSGVYFVPNGEGSSANPVIYFYDFTTHQSIPVTTVGRLVTAGPGTLAISPDETTLLYVHSDRDNRDIMLVEHFR